MRRVGREFCRIEHLIGDKHARTRVATGLVGQKLVAHVTLSREVGITDRAATQTEASSQNPLDSFWGP